MDKTIGNVKPENQGLRNFLQTNLPEKHFLDMTVDEQGTVKDWYGEYLKDEASPSLVEADQLEDCRNYRRRRRGRGFSHRARARCIVPYLQTDNARLSSWSSRDPRPTA